MAQLRLFTTESDHHRKVGWLELFYDLVYVAIIVQLGNKLSSNVSPEGFLEFALLFIPIWWVWMGTTFYSNRFRADDFVHRLLVFAQIFVVSGLAITVENGLGETSVGFALCYAAARGLLIVMYLRVMALVPEARPLAQRYVTGFTIAAVIWVISAFVPPPLRFGLWVVGLLIDFWTPLSPGSRALQNKLPPSPHHLPERLGLFTIIVFGESFIKVIGGYSHHDITLPLVGMGLLGIVLVGSMWWLYFENVADKPIQRATMRAQGWIYAHLPLQLGLTALAVGIYKIVTTDAEHGLHDEYRWLICGTVALCLLAIGIIELFTERPAHSQSRPEVFVRVLGMVATLALGFVGAGLDTLVLLGLLAIIAAVQVAFDLYRHSKTESQPVETAAHGAH